VVRLTVEDRFATLAVEDNGRGLSRDAGNAIDAEAHLGWLGMRERVTGVGGTLTIAPAETGGLRVNARIPLGSEA
jgi:signal transduction histidine kinase